MSQSMKAWPSSFLTCGCFSGFTSITPYWLNSLLSPWTEIMRSPRFLNDNQGQHVSVRCRRSVERRAHALADRLVPGALSLLDIDVGELPEIELGEVRAGTIAAGD